MNKLQARLLRLAFTTIFVAGCGLSSAMLFESPADELHALLDEEIVALKELYAAGAPVSEVNALVADFDHRAARLFEDLDEDERAAFEREVEERIAGELWGMHRRATDDLAKRAAR